MANLFTSGDLFSFLEEGLREVAELFVTPAYFCKALRTAMKKTLYKKKHVVYIPLIFVSIADIAFFV